METENVLTKEQKKSLLKLLSGMHGQLVPRWETTEDGSVYVYNSVSGYTCELLFNKRGKAVSLLLTKPNETQHFYKEPDTKHTEMIEKFILFNDEMIEAGV